jgi:AcrR family transcriptional regulator
VARDIRRVQILDVAQDLFARQGYHHVSMDDIADHAAVSKPVLYRHFPSKLDLYLDVIDHRAESLLAAIESAPGDDAAAGRAVLRSLVQAYVEFVERAGESFSLLFESDVTRDAEVRARVERASAQAAVTVCRGLRELAGLAPEHASLVSTALVGMARVAATARYRTGEVSLTDAVDLVTDLAWHGVSGFAATAAPSGALRHDVGTHDETEAAWAHDGAGAPLAHDGAGAPLAHDGAGAVPPSA